MRTPTYDKGEGQGTIQQHHMATRHARQLRRGPYAIALLIIGVLWLWAVISPPPAAAQGFPSTTFFVVAHADDWQLFMGVNSWNDVRALEVLGIDNKVVFIHTTAGDAGLGTGSNGKPKPYYVAREDGANRAIRFLANIGEEGTQPVRESLLLNGKKLKRIIYKNTVTYYFRLPDGNGDGNGFPGTDNQSLQRLYNGQIDMITSIEGRPRFDDWDDLVETLRAIITLEAQDATNVWINIQDPDETTNSGDHSDHKHTAYAMQDAVSTLPCVNQALFRTYGINQEPVNLVDEDQWKHVALWGVTTSGIADSYHQSTWDSVHNSWLGRQYYRIVQGNGACAFN